jgi:Amt family ammonium transporter
VHITSATTSAVYSLFFKWRRVIFGMDHQFSRSDLGSLNREYKPYNVINVGLGTFLLWVGWFGFNGGSALGANLRAVSACITTHLAACSGGVTGITIQLMISNNTNDKGKFSVVSFCNGVVAGLVAITPAAGYVRRTSISITKSILTHTQNRYLTGLLRFLELQAASVCHFVRN